MDYFKANETKSQKTQQSAARILSYVFLVIVTFISLFPIVLLIVNSTRSGTQLQTGFSLIPSGSFGKNLQAALHASSIDLPHGIFNSFIIAASVCLVTTYFSAMTAYGIHVYDFRLKKIAFNFILVIMMIPTQVSAVGFIKLVYSMKLTNNFLPLIIPAVASPAVFFYMKQYLESSLPLDVIEAARVDGSNEFATFNGIALPMMKPALAVQLIFTFVSSWNNFFTPALILTDAKMQTLPIMISKLKSMQLSGNSDLGMIYMVILISIIPVVIVYFCISKYIVEGVALGAVKG
ncbi:MAG: carbohydrate ABC transporter permease [Ruminococcus sp.]|nr:carbohydrate ABC transporter permease [Ruminococcus sp.]MCM1381621.1 carbohydrate ABC transporter permease [Muribaculaceae bacterium]MCM1479497.1 carbohydrate ABC transporter permease [Muribaculaceae bacterium]